MIHKLIKCSRSISLHFVRHEYQNTFYTVKNNTRQFCSLYLNYSASKYTSDDKEYILKIVNEEPTSEFKRFALSQTRIKNLKSWKNKRGDFKTVEQVLDVEGFSVKVLEKFCDSILENASTSNQNVSSKIKTTKPTSVKKITNFVTPGFYGSDKNKIQKLVSVYIGISSVSWSVFKTDTNEPKLEDWGLHDFTENTKKLHIANIMQLVFNIVSRIPAADAYVLESPPTNSPNQTQGNKTIFASSQRIYLISMISAILANRNSIANIDASTEESGEVSQEYDYNVIDYSEAKITFEDFEVLNKNNVYFLRPLLAARLYDTVVGNERVSTENVITDFINRQKYLDMSFALEELNETSEEKPSKSLRPPIYIPQPLKTLYLSAIPVHKEQLGQSLILGMAFTYLCLFKDIKCIAKVTNRYAKAK